jgi:formate dehydrogenase major subunit
MADLYLPLNVGTDVALLLGMAHVIVRDGLVNEEFTAARTRNHEEFINHVKDYSLDEASKLTGLPIADIEKAAHLYAEADKGAIYYTLGITEHICGVDNVQSLSNLALLTGHIGREGTGINPMRGQNNIQGAGDNGALPNNFPGFQPVTDPENQAKFEKAWGAKVDLEKGITKVTALDLCGESIFAMIIDGENTLVTDPDRTHCEHALKSLEHLVVIDIFLTETGALADVVLPATSYAETDGVCSNTERRVQRLRAAVPPQGQAKPDWWIISQIAQRIGLKGFDYQEAKEVFNEMCELNPLYNGLDWDRIDKGEYQWPVPHKDHPGTPFLHKDEFPIGKGFFSIVNYRDPAETISEEYPIWLTTGRRLEAYHSRTQTGRSSGIDYLLPEEYLEVNPKDVERLKLTDGGWCTMSSPRGSVKVKVKATQKSPVGTVFSSFSFDNVPVNFLTGSGYDPVTQTAELKVCPVKVVPA